MSVDDLYVEVARKFNPKTPIEQVGIGGKWTDYFKYLAEYTVDYFEELSKEIKKKRR